jgi:tRNA(His) 5'-end guanylyltransferase
MPDSLGDRMKFYYEEIPKTRLMRRTPVAIRLDGRHFHTFTRGFKRPFDDILVEAMRLTMLECCKEIQGCVLGYCQSDEITLILIDYQTFDTAAWFDYEVQKMCSIAASIATLKFNQIFSTLVQEIVNNLERPVSEDKYLMNMIKAANIGAMFDARCFNIPKEEVTNLIYWRQLDAERNSIQMVGQACFSHKELHGLSCKAIKEKLLVERNIDWESLKPYLKRGSAVCKMNINGNSDWVLREDFPMLKGEARRLVDNLVYVGEE